LLDQEGFTRKKFAGMPPNRNLGSGQGRKRTSLLEKERMCKGKGGRQGWREKKGHSPLPDQDIRNPAGKETFFVSRYSSSSFPYILFKLKVN